MKIGIIGSGNIGGALGNIWGRNGHEIMFSSRNPYTLKALAKSIENASIGPTGFYCGNDSASKAVVSNLIQEIGLEPIDVRPLESARYLEPLAMLMINLGFAQKMGNNIAIKLLRR